jgi:hypothetical protein
VSCWESTEVDCKRWILYGGVKLTNWLILRFTVRRIPLLSDDTQTSVGVLLISYAEVTVSTR